jgi:hypothetical protein
MVTPWFAAVLNCGLYPTIRKMFCLPPIRRPLPCAGKGPRI